jgi:hypothetical protein
MKTSNVPDVINALSDLQSVNSQIELTQKILNELAILECSITLSFNFNTHTYHLNVQNNLESYLNYALNEYECNKITILSYLFLNFGINFDPD